jgi:hypothetical protein
MLVPNQELAKHIASRVSNYIPVHDT